MRLSEWRVKAPVRDALGPKVMAVVAPVLGTLAVEDDPQVWVLWGDDPASRFTIYAPTLAGLAAISVRSSGVMGARASAKMIRWSRLQVGELDVETEGAHRMISFQIESAVLRGADDAADAIGRFALVLLAAIEGRPWPAFDAPGRRRSTGKATPARAGSTRAASAKSGSAGSRPSATGTRRPAGTGTGSKPVPALPARTATPGPRTGAGRGS